MLRFCIISDCDNAFPMRNESFDAFSAHNKSEVCECFYHLAGRYSVVYITEDFYDVIFDDCVKYNEETMPAVRTIPSLRGKDRGSVGMILNQIVKASRERVG